MSAFMTQLDFDQLAAHMAIITRLKDQTGRLFGRHGSASYDDGEQAGRPQLPTIADKTAPWWDAKASGAGWRSGSSTCHAVGTVLTAEVVAHPVPVDMRAPSLALKKSPLALDSTAG